MLDRASLLGLPSDPGTGEERAIVGARAVEYLVTWPEGTQYRAKLLVIHGGERMNIRAVSITTRVMVSRLRIGYHNKLNQGGIQAREVRISGNDILVGPAKG